ncbi:MAG TPA: hypothetical protein VGY57_07255 [Vicinamibacterales bacterium]|nr:hypothetical protein [Vicinamibacterales bacterium]
MMLPEIVAHVGRFCEVATRHGTVYGELVRLSAASFLIRPRFSTAESLHPLRADEITRVTPIPEPRR